VYVIIDLGKYIQLIGVGTSFRLSLFSICLIDLVLTTDGDRIGNWIYRTLMLVTNVTIALSLIHTSYSSLQHVIILFSLLSLRVVVWSRLSTPHIPQIPC
jgi:hypothetical protein